ncbi:MAG: MFS transporter [Chloroflexi bacterium]|nr:MFS transporter [Chloroflexota bacterium]
MFKRLRATTAGYPRQFWLLFWGVLVNSSGSSMVWPFLTIYLRQRLDVPLTTIALLFTLNSLAGFASTSLTGPAVDRFGRKGAMVLSLGAGCVFMLVLARVDSFGSAAVLMVLKGFTDPLYRVGSDAMVADLIPPARRAGAYSLLRMIANLGVAIGPSIGGFVTSVSYSLAFLIAAGTTLCYALLVGIFMRETIPQWPAEERAKQVKGYGPVLRDRPFMAFCAIYTFAGMAYSLMMVLLPVYVKENFGVPESSYGFILATNAAMVVLFQYSITQLTQRYHHLPVLAVGSLFYALGVGSVARGTGFRGFLLSMVILTIGELIMIPTSTALTANLAPPDMRGRYMGVYGLTWSVAMGIGPVLGGALNDRVAPVAIWYAGLLLGAVAAAGFVLLWWLLPRRPSVPAEGASPLN